MSKKSIKIICIVVSALLVSVFFVGVILFLLQNSKTENEEKEFNIWEQMPYDNQEPEEEEQYSSYKEAFSKTIQNKLYELKVSSITKDKKAEFVSAYFSNGTNPTVIVKYVENENEYNILVLKYVSGKLYTLDTSSVENSDLLIYSDCDIIVLRNRADLESSEQIIFDFYEGNFCAVKSKKYEKYSTEDMDGDFAEYSETAKQYVQYSENAVSSEVISYLGECLETTLYKE